MSTPHVHREESWNGEDELDPEFRRRDEEDRTVTARSRRAALSRFAAANSPSPPPPMPFFPSNNNQHPSPERFPQSPTASVFSVPNTIHTYSSSTPLVYGSGSHPHLMSGFALLPRSPPIHKERERRRPRKESCPRQEGRIELVDMAARCSFSDDGGEGPTITRKNGGRSATPMDVSSVAVDERRVFESTPPLPALLSVLAMMASGFMTTTIPATPTKGGGGGGATLGLGVSRNGGYNLVVVGLYYRLRQRLWVGDFSIAVVVVIRIRLRLRRNCNWAAPAPASIFPSTLPDFG